MWTRTLTHLVHGDKPHYTSTGRQGHWQTVCMELSHSTGVQVDKDTDTPCATLHKYRWTKTLTHVVYGVKACYTSTGRQGHWQTVCMELSHSTGVQVDKDTDTHTSTGRQGHWQTVCTELSHTTGVQVDKDTDTPCATLHKYRWTKTLTHLAYGVKLCYMSTGGQRHWRTLCMEISCTGGQKHWHTLCHTPQVQVDKDIDAPCAQFRRLPCQASLWAQGPGGAGETSAATLPSETLEPAPLGALCSLGGSAQSHHSAGNPRNRQVESGVVSPGWGLHRASRWSRWGTGRRCRKVLCCRCNLHNFAEGWNCWFFKRFSVWETFFRIFFFLTEYASKDENMFLKRVWRKFHRQELTLNTENATIFYF